jgi:hypothetical protein
MHALCSRDGSTMNLEDSKHVRGSHLELPEPSSNRNEQPRGVKIHAQTLYQRK